jgi:hypothetical protein
LGDDVCSSVARGTPLSFDKLKRGPQPSRLDAVRPEFYVTELAAAAPGKQADLETEHIAAGGSRERERDF